MSTMMCLKLLVKFASTFGIGVFADASKGSIASSDSRMVTS